MHPHLKLRCRKKNTKTQRSKHYRQITARKRPYKSANPFFLSLALSLSLSLSRQSSVARFASSARGEELHFATTSGSLGLKRGCVCFTAEISPKNETKNQKFEMK
jgi:hypothetical protein